MGRRRRRSVRCRPWLSVLTALGALVLPVAAAQADATWTGASTSSNWSDPTNWSAAPPAGSTGTLSFPTLGTCGTCYTSHNDLSGVSATSLVLGNSSSKYQITGNTFTVGAGGISDAPGGSTGDIIKAPVALSASQTWVVGPVDDYNNLTLLGGVTGGGTAVTMSIHDGDLFVDSDMEAGPVTKDGPGGLHIGGAPGTNEPGSINGNDGQAVTVNAGSLVANPSSKTGPLNVTGASLLLVGTNPNNNGTTTLHVNGSATLGPSITTSTFINNNGSSPGTDFSQLSAAGKIALGGTLVLGQGPSNNTGPCVTLKPGDVATLVTTSGTLSGRFANAAEGATLTMASSCEGTPPQLQIQYTASSVTATVVAPTTTALAAPSPSLASTNQAVMLTATVTTSGTGARVPDGTVAFSANGSVISGCAGQPLTTSGSSGTATCTTTFPANGSPESLTAAFNPANGSDQAASTSSARSLTVNPAATTTGASASSTSPIAHTSVTYTATVRPASTGPAQPAGSVAFLDGKAPISGCGAQPLTAGSSSSTAACTVSYPAAGSHTITATYTGDANFTGSTSQGATVTVQAPTTPPGGGSPVPGIGAGTPHGLVLSRVTQSHSRWREPHAHPARGVRSVPVGTRFTFTISVPAHVTFTFIQTLPGRRARNRCVAPGKARHGARACPRSRTRGRLVQSVGRGTHHLSFKGRIGRTVLPSGNYAVAVTAAAASGARSRTITLHFTIVD